MSPMELDPNGPTSSYVPQLYPTNANAYPSINLIANVDAHFSYPAFDATVELDTAANDNNDVGAWDKAVVTG